MNIDSLRDIPRPRTVLGWATASMGLWLVLMFLLAAVSGHSVPVAVGGWACIFTPVLIVMAVIDRVVNDRRGARDVHQQGGAWQVPEYMPEDVQHAPLPQQQPTQQPAPDHNPWA